MSNDQATNLFEGKKFWIAQRVPSRLYWIELLEKHGGHVAKLDTQADILIADHARKGAPLGSISWKFIEDSVKKGELEDPAAYPAGAPVPSGHVMAMRPSGKLSRTPFTAEDDRQLWDWVTDAESRGVSVSGNKLYQELEAKNPRHTWHSWRDRWLKSLAHRERPKTSQTSPQPKPGNRAPKPPPQNVGRRRVPASSSFQPNPSPAAAAAATTMAEPINNGSSVNKDKSLTLNEQKPKTLSPRRRYLSDSAKETPSGTSFTDEDEELLLSMSTEILDIDPEKETEAWAAFADAYTQHSSEEWKDFWDEVVRPSKEGLKAKRAKKSKSIAPKLTKDVPTPKLSVETQPQEREQEVQTAMYQDVNEGGLEILDPRECRKTSEALVAFLGAHESPVHFTVKEAICGKEVLLYDICHAITSAFDEHAQVQRPGRWKEVARLIGPGPSSPWTKVLKEKFSHVVDRFFEFKEFNLHLKSMQRETPTDEEIDEAEYVDISDSPIAIHRKEDNLGKRTRIEIEDESPPKSSKSGTSSSVNNTPNASKRQRIDKGKGKEPEIPSTPEHLYRSQPKRNAYQNFTQNPETQDFHFPQATQDEESLSNHSQEDSPSNQIHDEVYRASQRSPELHSESSGGYARAARGKMDRYMALGYTEEVVREALGATTSNDQHAAMVMEDLMQGKGIPDNLRGVWTAEDDLALNQAGGMERMIRKHGPDNVEERQIWLEAVEEIRRGAELG